MLPRLQSAYRRHNSTETALLRVLSDIYAATDRQDVTLLGLLDLSGAFDCVDYDILLRPLQHWHQRHGANVDQVVPVRTHAACYAGSECSSSLPWSSSSAFTVLPRASYLTDYCILVSTVAAIDVMRSADTIKLSVQRTWTVIGTTLELLQYMLLWFVTVYWQSLDWCRPSRHSRGSSKHFTPAWRCNGSAFSV